MLMVHSTALPLIQRRQYCMHSTALPLIQRRQYYMGGRIHRRVKFSYMWDFEYGNCIVSCVLRKNLRRCLRQGLRLCHWLSAGSDQKCKTCGFECDNLQRFLWLRKSLSRCLRQSLRLYDWLGAGSYQKCTKVELVPTTRSMAFISCVVIIFILGVSVVETW